MGAVYRAKGAGCTASLEEGEKNGGVAWLVWSCGLRAIPMSLTVQVMVSAF